MKRIIVGGIVFISLTCFAVSGFCWPWDKKAEQETKKAPVAAAHQEDLKPAPVAPQEPKEAVKAGKTGIDKDRMLREKKKSALNNSQWDVVVTALSGKGLKQNDVLTFYENKFSSDAYSKIGFNASNYTMTLQENGMAVVETMQTSEKEGIIFWRIELDPSVTECRGVLSRQLSTNKTEDYSFVSTSKKPFQGGLPAQQAAPVKEL